MSTLMQLLRPQQWLKNGFIALPMFFGGQLLSVACLLHTLVAFAAFSFAASAVYCLNDLHDREADRQHPVKCRRPLASGAIGTRQALLLLVLCLIASGAIALIALPQAVGLQLAALLVLYLLLNVAYTLRLKRVEIVDVFCIALGFVMRVVAGGVACAIPLSPWIVCMTFLLALFLGFAKRRDDVAQHHTVTHYTLEFLNQTLGILAATTMVCYVIYTVQPEVVVRIGSPYVYITAIFVLAGILRYLQLTIVHSRSGCPTRVLLSDRFIQLCILLWLATFLILIYL